MAARRASSRRIAFHTEINSDGWVRVVAAWRVARTITPGVRRELEREIAERLADLTVDEEH
jgi:hypothetical protein